ncbi:olfactory receptor 6B1-like [Sceloporus undulatus]|uniref:olfactory receptor 6B1-like n=1 Tax=Sceloporus undulatus TaxID=8520 RepID=UPI001C4D3C17|nr:olfactory receptor 6B1-like [Sceloporus undulatus]
MNAGRRNATVVTEFILLGFGHFSELYILSFPTFLVIYIAAMLENLLIVVLVISDQHLHTPMYFFLGNLSCMEIWYISNILPRMLANSFSLENTISFSGCLTQFFFFGFLLGTECCLLSVMSYDRYVAICRPLHYKTHMTNRRCLSLMVGSWLSGFLGSTLITTLFLQSAFCGPNEIDHFFCDFVPLVKLLCNDPSIIALLTFLLSFIFTLPPFLLTLSSYICIIFTILRIPSATGMQKAFSTCSSHLIVVTIFYGSIITVYQLPKNSTLDNLNKIFSLCYTILNPMINPLIYSLRNREVKESLKKALCRNMYLSSKPKLILGSSNL